jgi:hypothetical protein
MNAKNIFRFSTVGIVTVVVLFATFSLISKPTSPVNGNNVFNLQLPPFVGVANAQGAGPQAVANFLDDEAGISAYFSTTAPIDLALVRPAFRTIEAQTPDYIIGSVAIADNPQSEDVHVYVHKDGWLLAYYLKTEPIGKMFDWRHYISGTVATKLDKALATVAGLIGVTSFTPTYYDFLYPNANRLTLIAQDTNSGNQFQVNLPSSFTYYQRSWSFANIDCGGSWNLDGVQIYRANTANELVQGTLSPAQLTANTFHTVTLLRDCSRVWGGLALVYRIP